MSRLGGASAALVDDVREREAMWRSRETGGWEDWAVDPAKLGGFVRDLKALHGKFGCESPFFGPFGRGCVHSRVRFDVSTEDARRRYRRYMEEATDLAIKHGGVYSGGYGDGQSTAEFLPKLYGEELMQAFREFKRA